MAEDKELVDSEGVMEIYDPATHFGMTNVAELIDDEMLDKVGKALLESIVEDIDSRAASIDMADEWMKLATQVVEKKSFPWANASNVKYPLMTMACVNFHSRALPALVAGNRPVAGRIIGKDTDGMKRLRSERIGKYMSYQVLEQMEEWEPDMDRLLFVLPIVGLCFKKTTFSPSLRRLKSELLLPRDLIVNYEAKSFERARMTQVVQLDPNEYLELRREGIFLDVDIKPPTTDQHGNPVRDQASGLTNPGERDDTPYIVYESHCWIDLDEDGYKEPYVATIDSVSGKVLRIVPRWKEKDLIQNDRQEVIKIKAENYFTAYQFFPDPNSSVSGIGFGHLLGPTNAAVNTLMNQLIDSGTLNTLGGGFLGRGAKIKGGAVRFSPGEWKLVNSSGDDLRKSIFPMPVGQPSTVLLNLLQLLLASGEDIGRSTDMMKGNNPGQNQKVGTTMAVLQEGMKVYASIYKRLHRSLTKEYLQIFNLNKEYADQDEYEKVLDEVPDDETIRQKLEAGGATPEQVQQAINLANDQRFATTEDFDSEDIDIIPTSEAELVTDMMKLERSRALQEKLQMGLPVNPAVVTKQILEAEGHPNIEELMTMPEQQPSVEDRKLMLEQIKEQREFINSQYDNILKIAQAEGIEAGNQINAYAQTLGALNSQFDREERAKSGQQTQGSGQ